MSSFNTSSHAGFINYAIGSLDTDTGFHAAYARSMVANNIHHAADECGQVRVSFLTQSGKAATFRSSPATGTYYKIMQFGPFPVTMGTNPYQMRVRVAGNASAANSVTFRVVWSSADGANETGDNTITASTSSTTAAWLTGSSTLLTLTNAQVVSRSRATLDGVAGNPVSVDWTPTFITVWASTTNAGTNAELAGLYCAEYVGAST